MEQTIVALDEYLKNNFLNITQDRNYDEALSQIEKMKNLRQSSQQVAVAEFIKCQALSNLLASLNSAAKESGSAEIRQQYESLMQATKTAMLAAKEAETFGTPEARDQFQAAVDNLKQETEKSILIDREYRALRDLRHSSKLTGLSALQLCKFSFLISNLTSISSCSNRKRPLWRSFFRQN